MTTASGTDGEQEKPVRPWVQKAQTIAELHHRAEEHVSPQLRVIQTIHRALVRPAILPVLLAAIVLWVGGNLLAPRLGWRRLEEPPFVYTELLISTASLLLTAVVIIVQKRQGAHEQARDQLDLHANLLAEHKISKVISLLEELRRDLPNVKDRSDPEADALQESTDAHEVLEALQQSIEARRDQVSDDAADPH